MTSEASYKSAVPVEEALRRIEAGAGRQFDPEVVPVLIDLIREGAISADAS